MHINDFEGNLHFLALNTFLLIPLLFLLLHNLVILPSLTFTIFSPLPPPWHFYCFTSIITTITFLLFSLLHHHQPFSYLTSTNINTTFLLLYHHHHQIDCLKRRSNRPKPGPKSPIQAKIAKIRPKEEKELRAIYITCLFGGGGGKTINTFLILYSST